MSDVGTTAVRLREVGAVPYDEQWAGMADSIRKFSNRPITFELNRIGLPIRIRIGSQSFAGP